jgi:hypothetical protein
MLPEMYDEITTAAVEMGYGGTRQKVIRGVLERWLRERRSAEASGEVGSGGFVGGPERA